MQSDLCVCLGFAVDKRLVLIVVIETYAFSSTSLLWEGDNYIKDYWRHLLSGISSSCTLTIIRQNCCRTSAKRDNHFQVTSDHLILVNLSVLSFFRTPGIPFS